MDDVGQGKVHVTVFRNGRYVDAATIRGGDVVPTWALATVPGESVASKPASGPDEVPMSDVWVGVAAFIPVTLARRYPYLDAGIYGVREWRSIAAHAAAMDGSRSAAQTTRLLLAAVSFDGRNLAADLARINDRYGKSADAKDGTELLKELELMQARLGQLQLAGPMGLRLGFNLAVARVNQALRVNPTTATVSVADTGMLKSDWQAAAEQIEKVLVALFGKSDAFLKPKSAALPAAPADLADFLGKLASMKEQEFESVFGKLVPTTLARYERACVHAYLTNYKEVSAQLATIAGSETIRKWAREDPSLDGWWGMATADDSAYRALLDELPEGILNVRPFSTYQEQMIARGVSTAEELRRGSSLLASELGLGAMVGAQWRRVAGLQLSLVGPGNLDPMSDAKLLSRLLALDIDSEAKLVCEINRLPEGAAAVPEATGTLLAAQLQPRKSGYTWLPPTAEDFRKWAKGRGRP